MTTVTAAEFNQRPSQVKRAAEIEPVVITERNRPAYVLMTYAEYERLHNAQTNLAEWLEMETDFDFEIDQVGLEIAFADA